LLIIKYINSLEYDKFLISYELFPESTFVNNEPITSGWLFSFERFWNSAWGY